MTDDIKQAAEREIAAIEAEYAERRAVQQEKIDAAVHVSRWLQEQIATQGQVVSDAMRASQEDSAASSEACMKIALDAARKGAIVGMLADMAGEQPSALPVSGAPAPVPTNPAPVLNPFEPSPPSTPAQPIPNAPLPAPMPVPVPPFTSPMPAQPVQASPAVATLPIPFQAETSG